MAIWQVIPAQEVYIKERLDAEHFRPDFVDYESRIRNLEYKRLGDLAAYVKRGTQPKYSEDGLIPVLRTVNIREIGFSDTRQAHVDLEFYNDNPRGHVFQNDVLMTSTGIGTLGRVTYNYDQGPYFADGHITIIRGLKNIEPLYVTAFLQSRIGSALIERRQRGSSGQIEIYPTDIEDIPIPTVESNLQKEVALQYQLSKQRLENSYTLHQEAEDLLSSELKLVLVNLSNQTSYTAKFSDTLKAQRFDAEYFQSKYLVLLRRIYETNEAVQLGEWVREPIRRGVLPNYSEDNNDIPVINSQHVGSTHIKLEDNRFTSHEFAFQNQRGLVSQYDVLLNSTGYVTIGRCQTLLENITAFADGHVSIIRPKPTLDPVYLGFYLNSFLGQLQTERGWTGSSGQIELRPDVISQFVIWKAPSGIQKEIRRLVENSHQARIEARRLLENAKRKVEQVILGD